MTSNDPWATAAAGAAGPADETNADSGGLVEQYDDADSGDSGLLGDLVEAHPSLFTRAHPPNTTITGTIVSAPRKVHATCHPSQSPDRKSRLKLYWVTDPATGKTRPGFAAVDPITGKPNRKVEDQAITVQTDERDPAIPGDDGRRTWFLSGSTRVPRGHVRGEPILSSRAAMMEAVALAKQDGIRFVNDDSFIGLGLAATRGERENPAVETSSWFWQARLSR